MDNGLQSPGALCNGIILLDKGSGVRCRGLNNEQGNQGGEERVSCEDADASVPVVLGDPRPLNQQVSADMSPSTTIGTAETIVASNVANFLEAPKIGMVFNSMQDVELYYKEYAEAIGFGVSRVQGAYSKGEDRVRISTTWRCECYGKPDMRAQREANKRAKAMGLSGSGGIVGGNIGDDDLSRSKRRSKKCECKAMIYASVNHDGQWEIKRVQLEHSNHVPNPSLARLVKEYRMKHLTPMARKQLFTFFDKGVTVSQIHGCMGIEEDTTGSVALTVKDLQHEVYKHRRAKMEGGDSVAMMSFFKKMQARDDNFYHTQRVDEDGRLKDVLWVDARSRAAYEEFGDVICFDATYLTNEYELPFLNFVGVNHHGQSILLGCALVSHEDCDTFRWVFSQWLACMNNKHPKSILTDQAAAMRKPLEEIMPTTRHRWCIWHIMRKIPEKLSKCEGYKDMKSLLKRIVYESFTIQEFECRWSELIEKFELQSNDWLNTLYTERHMWVPAFMKEYFWAGMKTTQRVESINSFFDGFLTRNTKLFEFPVKYENALKKRIRDEIDADAKCSKYIRRLVSGFPVEKTFQKIYTDTKFQEVQTECSKMMYCVPRKEKELNESLMQYVIEDRVWVVPEKKSEEVLTDRRIIYTATFDKETNVVCCDCRKFETHGIVCRHTIRILDLNFVTDIPDRYIVSRWRKDILRKHTRIHCSYHDPNKTVEVKRFKSMMTAFEPICDEAAMVDDVTVQMVLGTLEIMKAKVSECSKRKLHQTVPQLHPEDGSATVHHNLGGNDTASPVQHRVEFTEEGCVNDTQMKDPLRRKRGRGRPKSTRYKGLSEIVFKKPSKTKDAKKQQKSCAQPARNKAKICKKGVKKPSNPHPRRLKTGGAVLAIPPPFCEKIATTPSTKAPRKQVHSALSNNVIPPPNGQTPYKKRGRKPAPKQSKGRSEVAKAKARSNIREVCPLLSTPLTKTQQKFVHNHSTPHNRCRLPLKRKLLDNNPSSTNMNWLYGDDSLLMHCSVDLADTATETEDSNPTVGKMSADLLHTPSSSNRNWLYGDDSLLMDCSIDLAATNIEEFNPTAGNMSRKKKGRCTPPSSGSVWLDDHDNLLVDCSITLSDTF